MPGCARLCLFALLGLIAAVLPVPAGTAADAAARWGLLGSWKIDCSAPASVTNGELRFVVRNGALFHDRDFGQAKDSNRVVAANVRPDGAIDLVVEFATYRQRREFVFSKGDDDRARTTSNRDVKTNQFSVAEGKFTQDGKDTPWQTHCP
jgi:hypothetical protein